MLLSAAQQLMGPLELGSVALFLTIVWITAKYFTRSIPSANFGIPGISNLSAYSKDPVVFLRRCMGKYGCVFKVNMFLSTTYWLLDKKLNKEYLDMREDVWSFGDGMGLFLNRIVVPGYFAHLRTFVSSLSKGITRKDTLGYFGELAEREIKSSLDSWDSQPEIELFESISYLVHRIIVASLMGPDFYEHHVDELFDLLHTMEENIGSLWNFCLPEWVPHAAARRLWSARDRVCEIFDQRLKERDQNPEAWAEAMDYISYTMRDPTTAHLKKFYGAHHTLLMFAAHTSTVASISWTVLELLKSPSRLQELRQDLDKHADPLESTFMDALIKETGRHYSGIADFRLARQSASLRQCPDIPPIPAGATVSISPYLTHHDPATWLLPDTWYPERWLEEPNLAKRVNSSGEICYMPFGAGSHRCPGEKLAVRITTVVVSTIAREAKLGWGEGGQEQDTTSLDFTKIGSPWLKGDVKVRISKK